MKKILSLLVLAGVMGLSIGCGGSSPTTAPVTPGPVTPKLDPKGPGPVTPKGDGVK